MTTQTSIESQRTRYSSERFIQTVGTAPSDELLTYMIWILWESSTEFMVGSGLPTNADVAIWVDVLNGRPDADSAVIQQCIACCVQYMID